MRPPNADPPRRAARGAARAPRTSSATPARTRAASATTSTSRRPRGARRDAARRRDRARYLDAAAEPPDAHRRPRAPLDRRPADAPRRRRSAIEEHLRHDFGYDLHSPSAGKPQPRRPLPLRVEARALRVLLDGDGDHAARRSASRRATSPASSAARGTGSATTTRCARATRTRGSRRTSTIRRARAGGRSTRRRPAARSRSSRRAASTTTCATSSRRSRSAGTRTSSATTCASRSASSKSSAAATRRFARRPASTRGRSIELTRAPVVGGCALLALVARVRRLEAAAAQAPRPTTTAPRSAPSDARLEAAAALYRAPRDGARRRRASPAPASLPPLRHAEELRTQQHPLGDEVLSLTQVYLEARFGGVALTDAARRDFERRVRTIRSLATRRTSRPGVSPCTCAQGRPTLPSRAPAQAARVRLRLICTASLLRRALADAVDAARARPGLPAVELQVRLRPPRPRPPRRASTPPTSVAARCAQLEQAHVHALAQLVGGHGALDAADRARVAAGALAVPRRTTARRGGRPAPRSGRSARTSARTVSAASPSVVAARRASHEPAAAGRSDGRFVGTTEGVDMTANHHAILMPPSRGEHTAWTPGCDVTASGHAGASEKDCRLPPEARRICAKACASRAQAVQIAGAAARPQVTAAPVARATCPSDRRVPTKPSHLARRVARAVWPRTPLRPRAPCRRATRVSSACGP